jgi:hypothetical protein
VRNPARCRRHRVRAHRSVHTVECGQGIAAR